MTQEEIYEMGRAEYLNMFEGYSLSEGYEVAKQEWEDREALDKNRKE